MGEIGLAGELRMVRDLPQRVAEAARMGFEVALVPAAPERSTAPRVAATGRGRASGWSRCPTSTPRCGSPACCAVSPSNAGERVLRPLEGGG